MEAIASYTGRSASSIVRDLDRFGQRGLEGLTEGTAPSNPPCLIAEVRQYMENRLSEKRTWNATQLAEAIEEDLYLAGTP